VRTSVAVAYLSVVFGAFGLLSTIWVFVSVGRGEYLSAIVALGAAIFSCGMIAMLAIVASRRVTPHVTCDEDGILIRPDRRVDGLLMASTFAGFVAMALYAIFTPLGALNIRAPRGNGQYLLLICAAAALVGIFTLRQIIARRGTSYLHMTEDGIETGNTMTSVERSWDEVADITDRPRKARRPSGTTYITTADGHTRVLPSDWYTPGGYALRELVRFYWQHPEARDELTDGRAEQRLEAETDGNT
jgi:hypothetical protein